MKNSETGALMAARPPRGDKLAKTPEERARRRAMARALWQVETLDDKSEDADAARARFNEERTAYVAKAGRLLRLLERKGFSLTVPEAALKEADQD